MLFYSRKAITKVQAAILIAIVIIAVAAAAYYYMQAPENQPPVAVAKASKATAEKGETITFNGIGSSDPDGEIASWEWDFGDGTIGVGKTVTHSYGYAGRYIVLLTVIDDKGANATNDEHLVFLEVAPTSFILTVYSPPIARIAVDKDVVEVGEAIKVDALSSAGWVYLAGVVTPTTAEIASWEWDFGDGTTGTGGNLTKTYNTVGNYPIKLTVTTKTTGLTDTTVKTVRVTTEVVKPPVKNPDTFTYASDITLKGGVIDPVMQTGSPGRNILLSLLDTLVWYGPGDTEPKPRLAESYEISEDGLTYTFHLRHGAKFWNGKEVTAEDVQYTFWRFIAMNIAGTWCDRIVFPLTGYLTGKYIPDDVRERAVAVVDNYTVRFNLPKPFAPFLDALSLPILGVLSKEYAITRGSYEPGENWTNVRDPGMDSGKNLMGSGPYKLVEHVPNDRIIMERFDDYWSGPAKIKTVVWLEITEWSTRQLLLLNGDVDATSGEASQTAVIMGTPGIKTSALPHGMVESIYFGLDRNMELQPPGSKLWPEIFNDVHMRRGIAYAFPYEEYLKQAWLGKVDRAYGNIYPGYLGSFDYQKDLIYDPLKATEEFKKAWDGRVWEEGFTVAFGYQVWMTEGGLIMATLLRESLKKINPKFDIIPMVAAWPTLLSYPLFAAWSQCGPDPRWYDQNWRSGQLFSGWTKYKNETLNTLLDKATTIPDPAEREEVYRQAVEIMREEVALIHTVFPPSFCIYRDWLQGVEENWNMAWYVECPFFWGLSKS